MYLHTQLVRRTSLALLTVLGIAALSVSAQALPSGVATPNCSGCHAEGGFDGDLSLETLTPLEPGQQSEFVLTVRESHMSAAGFYVTTGGIGAFTPAQGARASMGDLLHSRPNSASDGVAEIHFGWTPPSEPGGAEFGVYVVAANVDGTSEGDRAARASISLTWGCDPITLYSDLDTDGYGNELDSIARCGASEGWADNAEDCNDLVAFIHPGALEQANGRDDDCNGIVDDGIESALLYPDKDGDGFGTGGLEPIEGQVGLDGYAANAEDCDDFDPQIHPDLEEVCDGRDNDCDAQVDEGTYEYCGVGRCARRLELCDRACEPAPPQAEECNGLDDDCDGFVDNGELCASGEVCVEFRCTPVTTGGELPTPQPAATQGTPSPTAASPDGATSGETTSVSAPGNPSPITTQPGSQAPDTSTTESQSADDAAAGAGARNDEAVTEERQDGASCGLPPSSDQTSLCPALALAALALRRRSLRQRAR